jgi:hypothetical protein
MTSKYTFLHSEKKLSELHSRVDKKEYRTELLKTRFVIRVLDRESGYMGGSYVIIAEEGLGFDVATFTHPEEHESMVEYIKTLLD